MIPDNYSLWEAHEARLERELARFPVCDYCGEPITDENIWDVEGELYHADCAKEMFEKNTNDYIE